MASSAKSILRKIVPAGFRPSEILRKQMIRSTDGRAIGGPFKGIKLASNLDYKRFAHGFMLGTFEIELHPYLERIIELDIPRIINVGSAEGYYAIGMCMRMPNVEMIAYEMDEGRRQQLRDMATLNGMLDRLDVRGRCEAEDLESAIGAGSGPNLILIDVEGYEKVLLDPERIPALEQAYMLVEVHELFVPGVCELLHQRFSSTHEMVDIPQRRREAKDFEYHSFLTDRFPGTFNLERILQEPRAKPDTWMWLEPKSISQASGVNRI